MLKVKKLFLDAKLPVKSHAGDLGYDLFAHYISLGPEGSTTLRVGTGIAVQLPEGYGAFIKERSSLAAKGVRVGGGVIDNGYTGEIIVIMTALGRIELGEKIAQLVLIPITDHEVEEVEDLTSADGRGDAGFGSTGA